MAARAERYHTIDVELQFHDCNNCKKCKKYTKCIFRVPKVLRRQNPEAYTPDVVTIGPFHRPKKGSKEGKECEECVKLKECKECVKRKECEKCKEANKEEEFQLMEQVKETYLKEILQIMNMGTWKDLMNNVTQHSHQNNECKTMFENRAREFYAEKIPLSSEQFMKMMILDGCFLVQLFRKCHDQNLQDGDDPVFNMDCMFHFLCHDLLLLENQLPWFVLERLYNLIEGKCPSHSSLSFLILDVFTKLASLKNSCTTYPKHLSSQKGHGVDRFMHILDLVRSSIVDPSTVKPQKDVHFDPDAHEMHTATDLSKAGIRFKSAGRESNSIMDIKFEKTTVWRNGVLNGYLVIPQLNVGMLTESLFRNLIAIEQCYPGYSNEITSYCIFMDNLISSKEDLELLCKAKIIGNWLSDEDGCKFFNNLYKGIPHNKFHYVDLCEQLNRGYRIKGYTWVAAFKTEKFSNPWTIAAFFIGIGLLALSLWTTTNNIRSFMQK